MRSLKWWLRVSRPGAVILAIVGTWVAAVLSSPTWLSFEVAGAMLAVGFGSIGANLFHYGQSRNMFEKKTGVKLDIEERVTTILAGFGCLCIAVVVAAAYLPLTAQVVVVINASLAIFYPKVLSRLWYAKNATIAAMCASVVLIGGIAGSSGEMIPVLAVTVFCAMMAREIVKDIHDVGIDEGLRVTFPMKVGTSGAMGVAAAFAIMSLGMQLFPGFLIADHGLLPVLLTLVSFGLFLKVVYVLCSEPRPGSSHRLITVGTWSFLLAALASRIAP